MLRSIGARFISAVCPVNEVDPMKWTV